MPLAVKILEFALSPQSSSSFLFLKFEGVPTPPPPARFVLISSNLSKALLRSLESCLDSCLSNLLDVSFMIKTLLLSWFFPGRTASRSSRLPPDYLILLFLIADDCLIAMLDVTASGSNSSILCLEMNGVEFKNVVVSIGLVELLSCVFPYPPLRLSMIYFKILLICIVFTKNLFMFVNSIMKYCIFFPCNMYDLLKIRKLTSN